MRHRFAVFRALSSRVVAGRTSFTRPSVRRAARSSPWPVRWRLLGSGIGLVVAGSIVVAPALAIAGCPLVAHALALTVVGGDGRVACGL